MTEIEMLKYRIKELEEALGELWFTCGKFWDGDDSIEKLLHPAQAKVDAAVAYADAANAAYDTLRKSVLGRDYKLEHDK